MANEDFHEVYVRGPVGDSYSYKTFKRDSIQCIDKNGTETFLVKKPSLEMRITEKNGKKTIFYFDRIQVIDDNIIGHQSRFAGSLTKTISIGSISLIEIQDGKKNFKYVEK
ncbi:hypothetical protein MNBD_UNCLBAC01-1450 [hydrothermal vent metagenome]|uniref:Uncharacterized protein n=1 Tax=hydrothermal vent metagenome TaxID=652676 RepID=A0A3B1DLQ6_9ZZZZ